MPSFNFIGPAYESRSRNVACDRLVNMYPEVVESGTGASQGTKYALYGTPGRLLFATLSDSPGRCIVSNNIPSAYQSPNTAFYAVAGSTLFAVDGAGVETVLGDVGNDLFAGMPAFPANIIVLGDDLIAVLSAGALYVCVPSGPTLTLVSTPLQYITSMTWMSQRLIICGVETGSANPSNRFYISDLDDPLTFNALSFATKESAPDPIVAVHAAYEHLFLFGSQTTEIWYDAGAQDFPFQRRQGGGVVEAGIVSGRGNTIAKLDNTVAWLGNDPRGGMVVWELRTLTPVRVSNHYIENMIRNFDGNSAVGFPYQEAGHFFYVLHFPLNDVTVVYDSTSGMWHERGLWNGTTFDCDIARYHTQVQGLGHMVLDYRNGKIYRQDIAYLDDDGAAIRRVRVAPHINHERKWVFYKALELHCQQGASVGALTPSYDLRISDDGGYTWGNVQTAAAGQSGQYDNRVRWWPLGRSRDRVYEVSTMDAVPQAWVDAYLEIVQGNGS